MGRRASNKDRYNFLIDKAVYDDFSLICDDLGLIRSRVIERSMQEMIQQNSELLKEIKKNKR
jgi:hypothetical protein